MWQWTKVALVITLVSGELVLIALVTFLMYFLMYILCLSHSLLVFINQNGVGEGHCLTMCLMISSCKLVAGIKWVFLDAHA